MNNINYVNLGEKLNLLAKNAWIHPRKIGRNMRHFHRFSRAYRTWYKKAFFRYIILYRNGFKCQYRLSFNRLGKQIRQFS